ncbi:hypothetical protein FRC14_002012 [Serendipita sp. 396]|nr:hypothetical protein FRC14_002012 [Serendipita sp. 396]KAG8869842.1 hypothetical protein FRC20_000773 [Serendipita sp. 405]
MGALQSAEAEVTASLTTLLATTEPIDSALQRLNGLTDTLGNMQQDATTLHTNVERTAKTADRVGGRVRTLDEEMRRVREASERVALVMELQSSLQELHTAIEAQEWEAAARYCARAMAIPEHVAKGPFAESVVPTSLLPLPPSQTLQEARTALLKIFSKQFEIASAARDSANTSRVFKLFPEIGWETEGLELYASFVVDLIRARAPAGVKTSSPMYYIAMVTGLFESIAVIVDQHQPIVDKYYGEGKMLLVAQRLMNECDRVIKGWVEGWEEERDIKRKTFELLAFQRASHVSGAQKATIQLTAAESEEEASNAKEVDKIISEIAGLVGRWGLFRRFLLERLKANGEIPSPPSQKDGDELSTIDPNINTEDTVDETAGDGPEVAMVHAAASTGIFSKLTEEYYEPLELWHLRNSVEKAHRLSTIDRGSIPVTTTTPDDVFFILQTALSRLLSTASLPNVEKTIATVRHILEKDYAAVIRRKMDDVYRSSTGSAVGGQKNEKAQQETFITLLNDLDVSSSHMERLVKDLHSSPIIEQHFLQWEMDGVHEQLEGLLKLIPTFRAMLKSGLEELFNQIIRPRLRAILQDVYKDQTYLLDDDSYAAAESNDLVRKRFIKSWEALMSGPKGTFTETNYRTFFGMAIDTLVKPWEKMLSIMKYSELGAVRLDRDIRAVVGYLSSQAVFGNAREKFQRLFQISTLLNLDTDEDIEDFYNSSGIAWKLSLKESKSIAALRQS